MCVCVCAHVCVCVCTLWNRPGGWRLCSHLSSSCLAPCFKSVDAHAGCPNLHTLCSAVKNRSSSAQQSHPSTRERERERARACVCVRVHVCMCACVHVYMCARVCQALSQDSRALTSTPCVMSCSTVATWPLWHATCSSVCR